MDWSFAKLLLRVGVTALLLGTLSKRGWQRQRREARKICIHNPRILLSTLLWLPCMFLFSLKNC